MFTVSKRSELPSALPDGSFIVLADGCSSLIQRGTAGPLFIISPWPVASCYIWALQSTRVSTPFRAHGFPSDPVSVATGPSSALHIEYERLRDNLTFA
jgi:hypothetical protein